MWFLILIAIFVIGGIIYKMGETKNDTSQIMDGAVEGGCVFFTLFKLIAPIVIIILLIYKCS